MIRKILFSILLLCLTSSYYSQCATTFSFSNNCSSYGDEIDAFTLDNIPASDNGCGANGYTDYAAPVWTLATGGTYSWSSSTGGGQYSEAFGIWIDLNGDTNFSPTEMVVNSLQAATHAGTLTIPYSTALGTFKMRIMCIYSDSLSHVDVCSNPVLNSYGEVEDYMVTFICPTSTPTLNISASSTLVCSGSQAILTASGASSYTWSNGVTNGVAFSPTANATYSVDGSVPGCPSASATAVETISITSVPLSITATAFSNTICAGNASTLTANGASNYTWNPISVYNSSTIVGPSANTIYTVTGFNFNGCPGTAIVALAVNAAPIINISASNTLICPGNTVTLTISGNASSYTWNPGGQSNVYSITDSPSMTSIYSIIGTSSQNCTATANQVIVVGQAPVLTVTASNTIVCLGGSATLTATGASAYVWFDGTSASSLVVTPSTSTTFSVTGTNTANCSSDVSAGVDVFSPTIGVITDVQSICNGNTANLVASGADTYSWSTNSNAQSIAVSPTVNTTYIISGSVTDENSGLSCDATNTIQISINPTPTITATASRTIMCIGEFVQLTASGVGASGSYTWTGGPNAVTTATDNVSPISNQTYSVIGADANGCKNKTTVAVNVSQCTGLPALSSGNTSVLIYPNPSNGEFTIISNKAITLQIKNELGQHIKTIKLNDSAHEAEVSGLSNGIYFITGKNEDGAVIQKIIIAN